MIEDVFGTPSLPNVVRDCILFFENGEHFFIDKIYIFDKNTFSQVIEFGEVWINDLVFSGRKIAGYFSTSDDRICRLNDNPSRIVKVSKNSTIIMEGIDFVKINENMSVEAGYSARIRFKATALNYKHKNK